MRIFVVCDARGNVQSVAIPAPMFAANLGMEAPEGGRVHVLDVASRAMTREDLLDPKSEGARRKVYDRLRAMIVRTPTSRAGRRRSRRRRRR